MTTAHTFTLEVAFGQLDPARVRGELYANGDISDKTYRQVMTCNWPLTKISGLSSAHVPANRSHTDYIYSPNHSSLRPALPLEDAYILWQRRSEFGLDRILRKPVSENWQFNASSIINLKSEFLRAISFLFSVRAV